MGCAARFREPFLDRNPERGKLGPCHDLDHGTLPVGPMRLTSTTRSTRAGQGRSGQGAGRSAWRELKRDPLTSPWHLNASRAPADEAVPRPWRPANAERAGAAWRGACPTARRVGQTVATLGDADAKPVTGDVLAAEVRWPRSLGELRGKPVCLEFRVRQGRLFGFELPRQGRLTESLFPHQPQAPARGRSGPVAGAPGWCQTVLGNPRHPQNSL